MLFKMFNIKISRVKKYTKNIFIAFLMLSCCSSLLVGPVAVYAKLNNNPLVPNPSAVGEGFRTSTDPLVQDQLIAKSYSFALDSLGVLNPIRLQGVDARQGVNFNLRSDEVVVKASLHLSFSYSKDLLSDLSQINLFLNGESLESINIEDGVGGQKVEKVIEIPSQLVLDNNTLTFQLIGHYSKTCEDPRDSRLWAEISNLSKILVSTSQFVLQNDLQFFPLPFIDKLDSKKDVLKFVFSDTKDNKTMEAAGILASYFGSISSQAGVEFEVSQNSIPKKGNAIIFMGKESSIPELLEKSSTLDSKVSMVTNPNDSSGKLLIISGSSGADHKTAVLNLLANIGVLNGDSVEFKGTPTFPKRKPYDAPSWLSSSGSVKFSNLFSNLDSLNVVGYGESSVPLNVNLPPDLFYVPGKSGVKLNLDYTYDKPNYAKGESAKLVINDGNQFIRGVALEGGKGAYFDTYVKPLLIKLGFFKKSTSDSSEVNTVKASSSFELPISSTNSQLKIRSNFLYNYSNKQDCEDNMMVAPTKQSIDPNSTIDISHISHFVKMPNLSYFQLHGYPYSRMADLSETAFVITEKNRSSELLGTYLTVLGRIGNITRFPGLAVSVIEEQSSQALKGKDLIFIQNDLVDSDLVKSWNLDISMKIGFFQKIKNSIQNFSLSELFSKGNDSPVEKNVSTEKTVGQIIQVNSPISSDRTVVLISSISPAGFKSINNTLMGTDELSGKFFGGKVLITETEKISLESQDSYYLGKLSLPEFFQWSLQQHPILFVLSSLLSILFVTAFVHGRLKKKAKRRYPGHSH